MWGNFLDTENICTSASRTLQPSAMSNSGDQRCLQKIRKLAVNFAQSLRNQSSGFYCSDKLVLLTLMHRFEELGLTIQGKLAVEKVCSQVNSVLV